MASEQPGNKTISNDALVRHLQALGETPVPDKLKFHPPEGDWNSKGMASGLRSLRRRFQNAWLARNEGERRMGGLLLFSGHLHALASLLLFHGRLAHLPGHVLPLWLRLQPWAGFGLGLLLAAGGAFSLFYARNCRRTARGVFALYLLLFMLDAGWVLQRAARPSAVVYPLAAGLLIFLTMSSVCNFEWAGFFARRRRFSP
jgi:hypothetical protein